MEQEKRLYAEEYKKVKKQEYERLFPHKNSILNQQTKKMGDAVAQKIPDQLTEILEGAFFAGFHSVFDKGTGFLEKTMDTAERKEEFLRNCFSLKRNPTRRNLQRFDKQAEKGLLRLKTFAAAEGTLLGAAGIGLPDIPVFLGVLLRAVYGIALDYGFSYEGKGERCFILAMICEAGYEGERAKEYALLADRIGQALDTGREVAADEALLQKAAATALSKSMVTAKAVQGIFLIGISGGVFNWMAVSRLASFCKLKYKKRFLLRQGRELSGKGN